MALSFPTVYWKKERVTFLAEAPAPTDTTPAPAALVFPFYGDKVVLADIVTRGWCIPSGHIEPGETAEEAVRREAMEEAGVTLGRISYLGHFVLTHTENNTVRHAPTFIAEVQGFETRPTGDDSTGMQLAAVEDIESLYFAWDALLAAVFAYAYDEKQTRLPVGLAMGSLFE